MRLNWMPRNRVREGDRRPKSRAVQSEKGRRWTDLVPAKLHFAHIRPDPLDR
jgi:hypothetical protein